MNNPLVQKYQYYLNESHRLNEELKNEVEYSELLENILFELLGEDINSFFEDVQTPERKQEMKSKIRTAKKHKDKAHAEEYDAIDNEYPEGIEAAAIEHDRAWDRLVNLTNRNAMEKRSNKIYDKGGKIVKRMPRKK